MPANCLQTRSRQEVGLTSMPTSSKAIYVLLYTSMEFTAKLENFNTALWTYHIKVPMSVVQAFLDKGIKRLVCTIADEHTFQCALMPAGDGVWFININKKIRDKLRLTEGSRFAIKLEEDTSEFGLPFPEELKEVLAQDPEGAKLFYALTPGKQRNLIYVANQVKNTDLRIRKCMIMIDHLHRQDGKINFKALYQDLKNT